MGYETVSVRARRRRLRSRGAVLALAISICSTGVVGLDAAVADEPVAVAGASSATVTLRKGDRGPAVKKVQRRLHLTADGVFGPQTHRSVKRFQRRKHLVADGIVGPRTRRALRLRPFARDSVRHPRRSSSRRGSGVRLPAVLRRIAECESGGNPRAVSPGGRYRGKYQFSRSTWKHWGGRTADPINASESAQDRVALRLYRAQGTAPWPSCGRSA